MDLRRSTWGRVLVAQVAPKNRWSHAVLASASQAAGTGGLLHHVSLVFLTGYQITVNTLEPQTGFQQFLMVPEQLEVLHFCPFLKQGLT